MKSDGKPRFHKDGKVGASGFGRIYLAVFPVYT
jgi:hypothetical protein